MSYSIRVVNSEYRLPYQILIRYDAMLEMETDQIKCEPEPGTSFAHLRWMLGQLSKAQFTEGKACRWLGFIQGVMIERGLTDVTTERDFTRPFFKELDGNRKKFEDGEN